MARIIITTRTRTAATAVLALLVSTTFSTTGALAVENDWTPRSSMAGTADRSASADAGTWSPRRTVGTHAQVKVSTARGSTEVWMSEALSVEATSNLLPIAISDAGKWTPRATAGSGEASVRAAANALRDPATGVSWTPRSSFAGQATVYSESLRYRHRNNGAAVVAGLPAAEAK